MNTGLKFIADEGVERRIVMAIRQEYDVQYVSELMQGAGDDSILQNAEKESRILITLDKDFGELVYYRQQDHAGIILCRLHGLAIEEKISLIKNTINKYGAELLNSFTVIQPRNLRIRNKKL